MLWLLSGPPDFTCWVSFAPVFDTVLFTVESLSLLYLLLYLDLYFLGDDALINFFHANQTSMCLDPHLN